MRKLIGNAQGNSLIGFLSRKLSINKIIYILIHIAHRYSWASHKLFYHVMNSSEETALLLVSFIVLTLIVTLTAYVCSNNIPRTIPSVPGGATHSNNNHTIITVETPEPRLDHTSVRSYPSLQFSKAKLCSSNSNSSSSSCSICLMDYKDCDSLKVLPACGHFFHVKCVDPWLRISLTCPVCRTPIALPDICKNLEWLIRICFIFNWLYNI